MASYMTGMSSTREIWSLSKWDSMRAAQELSPVLYSEEVREACRAEFMQRSGLAPPAYLRVIDCERSVNEWVVVLIDWDVKAAAEEEDGQLGGGYTAISHTYGMEVYTVFDCDCAARCFSVKPRADPAKTPCKGHHHDRDPLLQQRKITDILNMCRHLVEAGVRYAWHDGVCIAQHDKQEVSHFIRHMGWIYGNAKETVIFLHYIGHPMAPIAAGSNAIDLTSRWHTRVWTFQEAALSKRRRYCVRRGESLVCCCNWPEFEHKLALWYNEAGNVTIVEEREFWNLIYEFCLAMLNVQKQDGSSWPKYHIWLECLCSWLRLLNTSCFSFPTIVHALESCSYRESKHEGDRINSILTLAGVKDFDAPKDENLEGSTMEFFKRMGKNGLALAVFTTNAFAPPANPITCIHRHTWLPSLSGRLMMTPSHFEGGGPSFHTGSIEFEILEDGNIELKGLLVCVSVQFNVVQKEEEIGSSSKSMFQSATADGGGLNVVLDTNNYTYLYYRASLAGAIPRVNLGEALLPKLFQPDTAYPIMEAEGIWGRLFKGTQWWDDLEAFRRSNDDAELRSFYFNRLRLPTVQHWCCHVQKRQLSFCASLIVPAEVLKVDFKLLFPAILVQGNIESQVAKIGCFHGSRELYDILQQQHVQYTTLTSLVIR